MRYTEMKYSGFPDIGDVPAHWPVVRIKHQYTVICGATPSDNPENWNGEIAWIGPADMSDFGKIKNGKRTISQIGYESCGTHKLPKGSVILSTRAPIGKIQIAGEEVCTNQGCKSMVKRYDKDSSDYLAYFLFSIKERLEVSGTGTTFKELSTINLKNMPLLLPSSSEQATIAAYLNEKCAAIDEIIAQAKATIEEYKAWKASVIFEAVTKGLDPNAEMKDSGVEWMGEIPKHWSCIPMKFMLNERNQKNDPVVTSERLSLSIDIGVTLYAEKTTNLDRFKEDVSQYKVAHAGDLVLNSMNMIVGAVGIAPVLGCVSPAYYVFYDNDNNYTVTRYCDYIFKNKRLRGCLFSLGQGIMAIDRGDGRINTCRLKVSRDDLGRIMLPCPPIEEQCRIISFLDKQCAAIDGIITEKQSLIDDLGTYKKSLIFETVTGKRRVF